MFTSSSLKHPYPSFSSLRVFVHSFLALVWLTSLSVNAPPSPALAAPPPEETALSGPLAPETLSAGEHHVCGLKSDGTLACWGRNDYGQATPPAGTFIQVSAGGNHTCGLKSDGTLACWGANTYGQAAPPAGTFTQVSAGAWHTCGLKSDGALACWGYNSYEQSRLITIDPATLPAGVVGNVYSQTLTASGGTEPFAFTVVSGALPPGMALWSSGVLSGTPTSGGVYTFTVQAVDSFPGLPFSAQQPYTLTINATYLITPTAGMGGSITPGVPQTVLEGDSITFTITADTGYHIANIGVDGVSQGAVSSYTFDNVTSDHAISATFAIDTFVITPTAGANGSITLDTPQTVNYGGSITFTIAADIGYHIADAGVDGVSQGAVSSYTFDNVTANHTITATFAINTYTLRVALAGAGSGAVTSSPSGINCDETCAARYDYNTVVTLTAAANTGSSFVGWSGAGCSGTGACVVTMDAAKDVTATFVTYKLYLPVILR
jgi:hypothetical protein